MSLAKKGKVYRQPLCALYTGGVGSKDQPMTGRGGSTSCDIVFIIIALERFPPGEASFVQCIYFTSRLFIYATENFFPRHRLRYISSQQKILYVLMAYVSI